MNNENEGVLYICGTPLGNLDDMTFRALNILKEVSLIAAEDTRRTAKLLNHFEINTKLTSYHEHNERKKAEELIKILENGRKIALVSDAGMPGISDPGLIIVKEAVNKNIEVIPVPGPTAAVQALVVSGLEMDRFVFEGFLPRKGKKRQERLKAVQDEMRTIIIYESPYRLHDTLMDFVPLLRDRRVVVVREITKVHEEKIYGTAEEIIEKTKAREIKGEIVIVIEGAEKIDDKEQGWEKLNILEHLHLLIERGYSKKRAIKEVARIRNLPKSDVYKEAVVIDVDVDN